MKEPQTNAPQQSSGEPYLDVEDDFMDVFVEAHEESLYNMTPINIIAHLEGSGVSAVRMQIENLVVEDKLRVTIVGPPTLVKYNESKNLGKKQI